MEQFRPVFFELRIYIHSHFFPDAVIEGSALFLSSNFANSILYFHIAVINAVSVGGMLWH